MLYWCFICIKKFILNVVYINIIRNSSKVILNKVGNDMVRENNKVWIFFVDLIKWSILLILKILIIWRSVGEIRNWFMMLFSVMFVK